MLLAIKFKFLNDEICELWLFIISLSAFMDKLLFELNLELFWKRLLRFKFTSFSTIKFVLLFFILSSLLFMLEIFKFEFLLSISLFISRFNSLDSILEFLFKIVFFTTIWLLLVLFLLLLLFFMSLWIFLFKSSFPIIESLFIKLFYFRVSL